MSQIEFERDPIAFDQMVKGEVAKDLELKVDPAALGFDEGAALAFMWFDRSQDGKKLVQRIHGVERETDALEEFSEYKTSHLAKEYGLSLNGKPAKLNPVLADRFMKVALKRIHQRKAETKFHEEFDELERLTAKLERTYEPEVQKQNPFLLPDEVKGISELRVTQYLNSHVGHIRISQSQQPEVPRGKK